MTRIQKVILEVFEEHLEASLSELIKITGIAKTTLNDNLKKLVADEKISKLGTGRNIYYQRVYTNKVSLKCITVFNEGIKVGYIKYGNGKHTFEYLENYKGKELLSLSKGNINSSVELFPIFENLLPEYQRREKLIDVSKNESLADGLVKIKNTHGSFDFVYTTEEFSYKNIYGDRPSWISVKNNILDENEYPTFLPFKIDIDKDILTASTSGEHSHLSGNQNKVDIIIDFKNKIIKEDLKNAAYILKPFNGEIGDYFNQHKSDDKIKGYYPFISINEHLFMTFAKNELNFNVPYSALVKTDEEFHYITKRYDRYKDYKYEQFDYAQFLNIKSTNKYKSTSEELFLAINNTLHNKQEKMEALRFYYYSSLIKHADLHTKNIGALNIGKNKKILTPLYDVISVGLYKGNSDDIGLSINYKHKNQKVKLRVPDFFGLADILDINHDEFILEAKKITKIFIEEFPKYIDKTRVLLKYDPLLINSTRSGYDNFIVKLANFYNRRIMELTKLGTLEYLELKEYEVNRLPEKQIKYDKNKLV